MEWWRSPHRDSVTNRRPLIIRVDYLVRIDFMTPIQYLAGIAGAVDKHHICRAPLIRRRIRILREARRKALESEQIRSSSTVQQRTRAVDDAARRIVDAFRYSEAGELA